MFKESVAQNLSFVLVLSISNKVEQNQMQTLTVFISNKTPLSVIGNDHELHCHFFLFLHFTEGFSNFQQNGEVSSKPEAKKKRKSSPVKKVQKPTKVYKDDLGNV